MTPWQPEKKSYFSLPSSFKILNSQDSILRINANLSIHYFIHLFKPNSVMQILKNKPMSVH